MFYYEIAAPIIFSPTQPTAEKQDQIGEYKAICGEMGVPKKKNYQSNKSQRAALNIPDQHVNMTRYC